MFVWSGMQESLLVFGAALPVYLIVAVGPVLRRTGALTPDMDRGVMNMAVHLFFPCLILDKLLGAEVLRNVGVVAESMAVGFFLILAATLLCWFFGPLLGLKKGSGRRTFAVAGGLQNYGYIAIPLVAYLFPGNNSMAVLFVHNLGVEFAMWTIGLMLLSGSPKPSPKVFLKGPIIAVVVGLCLVLSGGDRYVPDVISRAMSMLGACAVPISLLLVGTVMYDLFGKLEFDWKVGLGGVVVRLGLLTAMFLCVAKYLPMSLELQQVLVVQAALPSAMFPIVLSRHYGGRTDVAITVVISTTLVSLVTMPIAISLGKAWLGI